jgi:hypothetical protein
LTSRGAQPGTLSSEFVTLDPKRHHSSAGSDDHTRRHQLEPDVPIKPDGPVD